MKKKIAFKTLGCRLNLYETDAIVTEFQNAGYEVVPFYEKADAYVVNTCTVTSMSDHKSRTVINQAWRQNEDAVLLVTGCMVDNHMENISNRDHITYLVDNKKKNTVFQIIDSHYKGETIDFSSFIPDQFGFGTADKGFHTRSLIKIQDGCDNYCTFCIIPFVRGRAVSRPPGDVIANIKEILSLGFREIVITGVNIGRYNSEGIDFESLISRIVNIEGDFRVRISSIEPDGYGEQFYDLLTHPKLTPHLHLCMQSGSDRVLLKMRRMYDTATFLSITDQIRKRIPDFNFTTDIMVGFPGETEEDFEETCAMIRRIEFSHIHAFKYSSRKGTRAQRMEDHIPEKVKTQRSAIIRQIATENKMAYRSSFIGKSQRVLTEKILKHNLATGYGQHYIPVKFTSAVTLKPGEFTNVRITGIEKTEDSALLGEVTSLD